MKSKSPRNIVIGQGASSDKVALAKELRRNMTEAEKVLWQCLRTNRVDGWHFRRQQVIAGFIVDFYCHAAALAVEVDGPIHAEQAGYDQERDRVLGDHNVRVLRLSNDEVIESLETALQKILKACGEIR